MDRKELLGSCYDEYQEFEKQMTESTKKCREVKKKHNELFDKFEVIHNKIFGKIGENVEYYRKLRFFSREALNQNEKLGTGRDYNTIEKIESGKASIEGYLEYLPILAHILDVPLSCLLSKDKTPTLTQKEEYILDLKAQIRELQQELREQEVDGN